MEQNLDWDLPAPTGEEAVLDPYANVPSPVSLPEDVAKNRALKAKIAFTGDENAPSYEEILNDVKADREDRLRDRLAASESLKKMRLKQEIIREVVNSGDTSPESMMFVRDLSVEEMAQPQDILEKKYAEWRMNMGLVSDESGTVDRAMEANPEGMNGVIDASVDRIYRHEFSLSAQQRAQARYDETGFIRGVIDFTADIIPFYTWLEDRNIVPDSVVADGFLPGEYRRAVLRDLAAMSPQQFAKAVEEMEQKAIDSGDHAPFIKLMEDYRSYTQYDAMVDTAWGLVSGLELVPGVGLFGDIGLGAAKIGAGAGGRKAAQKAAREAVLGGGSKEGSSAGGKAAGGASEAVPEPTLTPKEEALSRVAEAAQSAQIRGADGRTYTIDGNVAGETVKNAAVRIDGKVYEGPNHGVALDRAATELGKTQDELLELIDGSNDGFVTSTGRFVSREEADQIAKGAGQKKADSSNVNFLGSEDLVPAPPKGAGPHVVESIINPKTGEEVSVSIPATDENLAKIYNGNTERLAHSGSDSDMANTLAGHGDLDKAAFVEATKKFTSEAAEAGKKSIESLSEKLARRLPSLLDPIGAVVGRPAAKALYKLALQNAKRWESVLARQARVQEKLFEALARIETLGALRWSDEVYEAAKPAMREQMDKLIGTPSSAIQDIKIDYLREWQTGPGRTIQVVYTMGRPDGSTFESIAHAETFAREFYNLAPGYYSVESLAPNSFKLRVAKYVDETDPNILKYAIQTDTKTPMSWTGAILPYFRGSAGVSSKTLQENLKVSSNMANALHEAFMVAAKDVGKMTKKEIRNLDALMEAKRDVEKIVYDPVTGQDKKVRGEWFNNATELEQTYKRAFGEYPSDNVVSAYFTMRQMYDFDLTIRNLHVHRDKVRQGAELAKLHIPVPDKNDPSLVEWRQMGQGVEMKFVDELPDGNLDVLILNSDLAQANLINTAKAGREGIKDLVSKGYKIMQVFNPDQRPFKAAGVNDNLVQFVVAKDVERSPLLPDQIPATEGGHVRYREGFYIKQPKFEVTSNGDKLYLSDRSLFAASTEAEAKVRATAIETARQLLKEGKTTELAAHLANNLPWTLDEFAAKFRPRKDSAGNAVEPDLDIDTPITWVADGQGVNDASKTHATELASYFQGVRDTIDDPNNLMRGVGKKYIGEKDFTLEKIISGDGNLWEFDKARMVSPMETLEKAWAEISQSMATDDMKIQAMTNWIEEAASALETPIEVLRQDPWAHLMNPRWNMQYGDVAKRRTLDAQRRQIISFLGQKDQLGSTLDWMRNKMMNYVFEKRGGSAADWVDDHILPNVKNPLQFMRSFAFHTKMGFFNPIQLFLQANQMINTWAITGNPARVGASLSGVMLMHAARFNRQPEILADLGKKAMKLGWKAGEWEEMERLYRKTALHTVEGEHGTLDIMTNPKMFKGIGGNFLDKGLFFFREIERTNRMNAWAIAFKEYRDKLPTKVLDNSDINKILSRQEVLYGNMTRGSNALYQKGLTGPMTQFWGYQARITEQLLGKQLTRGEKLRLMAAHSAMYGMPVSLGAATFMQVPGWSTDDLRQYAMENNIDINSGIASIAVNGLAAEMIRWGTSDESGQGGLLLNIGDRYGPGGLPVLRNLVEAKDGVVDAVIDLAFGASGSITRDFFAKTLPDDWDIIDSAINGPKLGLQDYANMFSTISTVNNTSKLIWALQTHKLMTKDGLSLGDKSPLSAWISFTTGLEERRLQDQFIMSKSLKDLKTANEELGKEYLKQIRKAKTLPVGSPDREYIIRKARALIEGMDPNEVKKYLRLSLRETGDLDELIKEKHDKAFGKE